MPAYHTIPQDVLFFRDGRPMEAGAGSGGHGARWPDPSIIFDAVHAALHRAFPVPAEVTRDAAAFQAFLKDKGWLWQHPHRYVARLTSGQSRNRQPDEKHRNQRFGALRTAGPFPAVLQPSASPLWLFPAPADYMPGEGNCPYLAPLQNPAGRNDLPTPLLYPLGNACEPSKEAVLPWWTKNAIEAALRNEPPAPRETWSAAELYGEEWVTGIGIDPERQTQDGQRIYSAQYLRLRDHAQPPRQIALGFHASLLQDARVQADGDGMRHLFPAHDIILCGGQQRACRVEGINETVSLTALFPCAQLGNLRQDTDGKWRLKWLLLSPAVFPWLSPASPGGWLPNWIAAAAGEDHGRPFNAGDVLLKPEIPAKQKGESRYEWRKRIAREVSPIKARLVAARVPKPITITGWSERLHEIAAEMTDGATAQSVKRGPRPTHLAVPAGAVYYFEADSETDARNLAAALNWHGSETNPTTIKNRRSTLLGEKGYGLGVCGTWQFYPGA